MDRITAAGLYASTVAIGACPSSSALHSLRLETDKPSESRPKSDRRFEARRLAAAARLRAGGPSAPGANRQIHNELSLPKKTSSAGTTDKRVQAQAGASAPGILGQFDGGSDDDNANLVGFRIVPPDTNGDVGPNHYVQFINLIWTVYDKSGTIIQGPLPGNSVFAGSRGLRDHQRRRSDGQVRRLADRWVLTQFAVPNYPNGPSYQCFAVSRLAIQPAPTTSTSSRSAARRTAGATTPSSASGPTATTSSSRSTATALRA